MKQPALSFILLVLGAFSFEASAIISKTKSFSEKSIELGIKRFKYDHILEQIEFDKETKDHTKDILSMINGFNSFESLLKRPISPESLPIQDFSKTGLSSRESRAVSLMIRNKTYPSIKAFRAIVRSLHPYRGAYVLSKETMENAFYSCQSERILSIECLIREKVFKKVNDTLLRFPEFGIDGEKVSQAIIKKAISYPRYYYLFPSSDLGELVKKFSQQNFLAQDLFFSCIKDLQVISNEKDFSKECYSAWLQDLSEKSYQMDLNFQNRFLGQTSNERKDYQDFLNIFNEEILRENFWCRTQKCRRKKIGKILNKSPLYLSMEEDDQDFIMDQLVQKWIP